MAHGKQSKTTKSDGKHRKETKEERRARLQGQEEARQACFKALPYVGMVLGVLLIVFTIWVRSVPPKIRSAKDNATTTAAKARDSKKYEEMQKFADDVMAPVSTARAAELKKEEEAEKAEATKDSKDSAEGGGGTADAVEPEKPGVGESADEGTIEL